MSAETLLTLAFARGLLDAATVEKLRQQMSAADRPVSEERLLKLLIKKEKITKTQAKSLLEELQAKQPPSDPSASDLGLAVSDSSPSLATKSTPPATPPVKDPTPPPLEEVEDDESLLPLEALDGTDEASDLLPAVLPETLEEEASDLGGHLASDELLPLDDALVTGRLDFPSEDAPSEEISAFDAAAIDEAEPLGAKRSAGGRQAKQGRLLQRLWQPRPHRVRKNRWDSPLLLLGGGGLVLLSLAGLLLWFVLTRGSGDEYFSAADEEYRGSSYSQAVYKFEQYLVKFPSHPKASLARCRIGLAKIRQAVESSDWQRSLATASAQLEPLHVEAAFDEVRPELQGILPEIYEGFVDEAQRAEATEQKEALIANAREALALVDNPDYLPTSQRRPLQGRIDAIAKEVVLIERDINRDKELQSSIEKIRAAATAGDTAQAYEIRRTLLSRYPELTANGDLLAAVLEITQAEVGRVEVGDCGLTATTEDLPSGPSRKVVLVERQGKTAPRLEGDVIFVQAQGGCYGLDASSGALLWRRWAGFASTASPLRADEAPGADAILLDGRGDDLLRLQARTGQLVWRLPLGEPAADPVIGSDDIYVTLASGKLIRIDADTGQPQVCSQFPQPLNCSVGTAPGSEFVFQPGQHSSLYVCDAKSLVCQHAYYVGHKAGTIHVPPVVAAGHVFLAESAGADYATLHVLRLAEDGALAPVMEPIRLDGAVSHPLLVSQNRVVVITDLGAVYVFVADPTTGDQQVRRMAQMLRTTGDPKTHYALIDRARIFVAADALIQYELQAARGELVRKWVSTSDDVYVGAMTIRNDVLIHQKRAAGSYATTVSAVSLAGRSAQDQPPEPIWTTQVGIQPAAEPIAEKNTINALSSDGAYFRIDMRAVTAGKLDRATRPAASPLRPPLHEAAELALGRVALANEAGQPGVLMFDSDQPKPFRYLGFDIPHPLLATDPIAFDANGLLVCTSDGPVFQLDLNGRPVQLPYQPELVPGRSVAWIRPVVLDGAAVIATADGEVHRLANAAQPQPHLTSVVRRELNKPLARSLAGVGDRVFALQRERTPPQDRLRVLSLERLEDVAEVACSDRVVWGPERIGDFVLVAMENGQLMAVEKDGKAAWSSDPVGPLAGRPLALDGALYLATDAGKLLRLELATGRRQPWDGADELDLGEPLGTGPTPFASRFLMMLGRDSTLHVVKLPAS